MFKRYRIRSYQVGLVFGDGDFKRLLQAGRHWIWDPRLRTQVDVRSMRDPQLIHDQLDMIVRSGALKDRAMVLDLKDHQRALGFVRKVVL